MLNRRAFLQSAAIAAVAVTISPKRLLSLAPPQLHGDGVQDDTATLQAILDRPGGGPIRLPRGNYRISRTLVVRRPGTIIEHSTFRHSGGGAALEFQNAPRCVVVGNTIESV